jgi:F-type H+-transporting ATPase subunit delta
VVARRYAKALFLFTEKRAEIGRALEDLKVTREVLAPGARVRTFLASPEVAPADKRRVLRGALEGRALPSVIVFLDLLLRKKRLAVLGEIADEYEALVERAQGVCHVHVVSAVPLTADERRRLEKTMEGYTQARHVRLDAEVDPDVVGGALVRIGDRLVDRTVTGLLGSLRRQLSHAVV